MLKSSKRVFLTGATGILGSWLLAELLKKGHEPVVLMRDDTVPAARTRLRKALSTSGRSADAGRIKILLGDVGAPYLGLPTSVVDRLRKELDVVIHCAASVSFDPGKEDDTWQTNVQGTGHMLDFLGDSRIPYYHVSTAYVGGRHAGVWAEEDLEKGQEFTNAYERSKCECEKMVQASFASGVCRGAIFRPSIIVGSATGGEIAQFLNFYGFLKLVEVAARGRVRHGGRVRFATNPECALNLVPVDWTARALVRIIESEGPSGAVYNLTNPNPPRLQHLIDWANETLAPQGVRFEAAKVLDHTGSPLERLAHLQMRHYHPYMMHAPVFDRSNTDRALGGDMPFPPLDANYLDSLYTYARSQRWRSVFSQQHAGEHEVMEDAAAAVAAHADARLSQGVPG